MPQPKPLILIVEDEKELANLISEQLEMAGMMTQVYHRISRIVRFLKNNFANLLLLDINLPDGTGFSLMEELRRNGIQVPVIFLTGNNSEVQKVKGLEMGGDDYITKPFSFPELIARIHAVLRRAETSKDNHITQNAKVSTNDFKFCTALVSPGRMEIIFDDGTSEKIGRKELGILTYLVSNPHTVLTRRSLIHSVWGIHADVRSRSLDQYIVKIRDHFSRHNTSLDAFRTIHGVGYIYDPKDETTTAKDK
ncbi:MAG: response regulator transcription factor [Opitutales bacterium]|nr:response regulator transcription factor [Opitutales bacterium]